MLQPKAFADHEAVSLFAADWLCEQLRRRPDSLLCLATGSTPTRTYELLAARGAQEPALFAQARVLNLDEWGGLPPGDPGSCDRLLRTTLIEPLGMTDRYVSFASDPADPAAEAARIGKWLAANGPIDVSLLGLGINGHIGFNEPADALQPHAHVADLSDASLSHAMVRSGGARPSYGLTLGMGDLLQSRQILLLVTGATKREPLLQLRRGRITTQLPASLLHLHASALLLYDEAAAAPG
jgi:galactosamine-6-phosphate isomerase